MKKDFQKTGEKIEKLLPKLRQECIDYISEKLKENKKIDLYDEEKDIEGESIYVAYDGGNHPEYASNLYSLVYDVHLNNNGKVALNTEDADDYEIDRLETMEIYDIACFIEDME